MFGGLKNNIAVCLKLGDVVYVSNKIFLYSSYSYTQSVENIEEVGYGIIVEQSPYNCDSDYLSSVFVQNQDYTEYLSSLSMFGVLINGKVNWYSSDEIFRINSWDSS